MISVAVTTAIVRDSTVPEDVIAIVDIIDVENNTTTNEVSALDLHMTIHPDLTLSTLDLNKKWVLKDCPNHGLGIDSALTKCLIAHLQAEQDNIVMEVDKVDKELKEFKAKFNNTSHSDVYYLHKEYNGMPVGTPMLRTEPTSAHLQARAMLKNDVTPGGYFKCPPSDVVHWIPFFDNIIENVHPNDPRITGPFLYKGYECTVDRLPNLHNLHVHLVKEYPYTKLVFVLDDRYKRTDVLNVKLDKDIRNHYDGYPIPVVGGFPPNPIGVMMERLQSLSTEEFENLKTDKLITYP